MSASDRALRNIQEPPSGEQSQSPSPTAPTLTQAGRPQRTYRLPARYDDIQPVRSAPLPPPTSLPPVAPGSYALPRVILHVRDSMCTKSNEFGLLREYPHLSRKSICLTTPRDNQQKHLRRLLHLFTRPHGHFETCLYTSSWSG